MRRFRVLIPTALVSVSLLAAGHDLTPAPAANQMRPVVTGNGSGFMAVWIEPAPQNRNSVVSQAVSAGGEPIFGAGAAIDQPPVWSMAIAHSPSDSLAVWIAEGNVYAQRLSPSGMPLSTILLTPAKSFPSDVAVAWNGSRYFVIWSDGVQLAGAFVAPDGLSTTPRLFFTEPNNASRDAAEPAIAWNGQHFVVVFGERPNNPCNILCPIPNPDKFRVMRVSAAGDAIDTSPLVITGNHYRAHLASSGAESLIALDSPGGVSTIIAHDQSMLTLDAESPLFRWVTEVASAVVWDGAKYMVGWRYVGADASWIGAASVTPSGLPFDYRFTVASILPFGLTLWSGRPSMAVNDAGLAAFAFSDAAASSSLLRARLYLAPELGPMPEPPSAPRNVVSFFAGNTARIDWQSDGRAGGFAVESWSDYYNTWNLYRTVPGDARTTTVSAALGSLFRIRAFGPGGVSEGAVTSIGSMQRRRAAPR
jgi:hypothetical protein